MLANSNIPQISIENEPIVFVDRIKRYWWRYPNTGPVAIPCLINQSKYIYPRAFTFFVVLINIYYVAFFFYWLFIKFK